MRHVWHGASADLGRLILRHDTLTRIRGGRSIDEPIEPGRLRAVAREQFGVILPDRPLVFEQTSAAVEA